MPALNFKKQFVPLVKSGRKPHSIRAWRTRPFKVGDTLMFYTGMRTKQCRKIRRNTACVAAVTIEIDTVHGCVLLGAGSTLYRAGVMDKKELTALAVLDGFDGPEDFFRFFLTTHGANFTGQLIEWES